MKLMTAKNKTHPMRYLLGGMVLALGATLCVSGPASAQTQTPKQPQLQLVEKSKHGDWTIRCRDASAKKDEAAKDPSGKSDLNSTTETKTPDKASVVPPQCVMIQVARHPEQKNLGLSVLIVKQTVQEKPVSQLRITTPLGVFLPAGVGVEIDGAAIGRLGYEVCTPPGVCTATTFLNDDLLKKFKGGAAAKLYLKDMRGRDSIFDLSLKGFTKGYDEL